MQSDRPPFPKCSSELEPDPLADLPGDGTASRALPELLLPGFLNTQLPKETSPLPAPPLQPFLLWVVMCPFSEELWAEDKVCFPPEQLFQEITFSR